MMDFRFWLRYVLLAIGQLASNVTVFAGILYLLHVSLMCCYSLPLLTIHFCYSLVACYSVLNLRICGMFIFISYLVSSDIVLFLRSVRMSTIFFT
jgi:hypothetical protein